MAEKIQTNAGILLIGPLETNFSDFFIGIQIFSFKRMHLRMFAKWCPFCLDPNVLRGSSKLYQMCLKMGFAESVVVLGPCSKTFYTF